MKSIEVKLNYDKTLFSCMYFLYKSSTCMKKKSFLLNAFLRLLKHLLNNRLNLKSILKTKTPF